MGGQFPRILCSSLLMACDYHVGLLPNCFRAPRSPPLTSVPLLNTNSTLLLIIVEGQKKKLKNSHRKSLFARKLLVSYIQLFVVWFAQITILTSTDIQIKDRITLIPIKIAFILLSSPFFCFLILSVQP